MPPPQNFNSNLSGPIPTNLTQPMTALNQNMSQNLPPGMG